LSQDLRDEINPLQYASRCISGGQGADSADWRSVITKLTVALKIGADTEPFSHSLGHKQTHASQQTTSSLDHLVSSRQQCRGHRNAHPLSGLEVDHQLELGRLFDWDIGDLAAHEEFDDLLGHYF
jgi:hypothetical protein